MASPISIRIPHQLGRAEARRRVETGFAKIVRQVPGGDTYVERWEGDRMAFSVTGLGQTISGVVNVLEQEVAMEIQLPGVLGLLANGLKRRLQDASKLLLK